MGINVFSIEDRDGTGESGTIIYDDESKKVEVNLPVSQTRKNEIKAFLTTEREFIIPESGRIDDFRIDKKIPVDDPGYFRMAMSELYGATGIYVLW